MFRKKRPPPSVEATPTLPTIPSYIESARLIPPVAQRLASWLLSQEQPPLLLCCDRNAQPIGRGLEMYCAESGIPLPVWRQRITYKKVTAKLPQDVLRLHLKDFWQDVQCATADGAKLCVLDEYIANGLTKGAFRKALAAEFPDLGFTWLAVNGRGADVSLGPIRMDWRDIPEVIGIDYTKELEPMLIQSDKSDAFYRSMAIATRLLVHGTEESP